MILYVSPLSAVSILKPLLNNILSDLDIQIECDSLLRTAMKSLLSFLIDKFKYFVTVIVPRAIKSGIDSALRILRAVKDALLDVISTVGKALIDKFHQYATEKPTQVYIGGAVGAMSGAVAGACLGSLVSPVGMCIGAAVGVITGLFWGGFAGYWF